MFKAVIEQQKLLKALKDISGSVGKGKGENPTDCAVYMESFIDDGGVNKVKFCSTNFNEWSSSTVETVLSVSIGVAPLAAHDRLMTLISTIDPTVEITIEQIDTQKLNINYVGRKSPIELMCYNSDSFVKEPERKVTLTTQIPLDLFESGLDKAAKIITDSDKQLLYNCVNITVNPTNVVFEAIDSITRRVMLYAIKNQSQNTGRFFVECNKIKTMLAGFDKSKPVTIEVCDNNIAVTQDGMSAILRLLHGSFPDTKTWFPNQCKNAIAFNKDEMIKALKRIQAMYDPKNNLKTCCCKFDDMFSTITQNSTYGKIEESIVTKMKGSSFEKAFIVDTFIKSLYTVDTTDIQMMEYDSGHVSIAPVNAQGYIYKLIIMQVKVQE